MSLSDCETVSTVFTDNYITGTKDITFEIPKDGMYGVRLNTATNSVQPFLRVYVNNKMIFEGYGKTGTYIYLWMQPIFLKKGTILRVNRDNSDLTINQYI